MTKFKLQVDKLDKINADRQIIHCIYDMMPTMEDALYCMLDYLDKLEIEKAGVIFYDVCNAIQKINENLLLLQITEHDELVAILQRLRAAIGFVANFYEYGQLIEMKNMVDNFLIPYYDGWREEVLLLLSGRQFAYLQN